MDAMKKFVAKAPTPWPQVFLIRNLCDNYGLTSMWKILQAEKWILPQGVDISQVSCSEVVWAEEELRWILKG